MDQLPSAQRQTHTGLVVLLQPDGRILLYNSQRGKLSYRSGALTPPYANEPLNDRTVETLAARLPKGIDACYMNGEPLVTVRLPRDVARLDGFTGSLFLSQVDRYSIRSTTIRMAKGRVQSVTSRVRDD